MSYQWTVEWYLEGWFRLMWVGNESPTYCTMNMVIALVNNSDDSTTNEEYCVVAQGNIWVVRRHET